MFKPGDIVCLTDEAIAYYSEIGNEWWENWWGKNAIPSECLVKVSCVSNGDLYGENFNGIKRWRTNNVAPARYFKLYNPLSKEEKILRKISYLYSKCKTTKQWATS